jgi:hypothetical protein
LAQDEVVVAAADAAVVVDACSWGWYEEEVAVADGVGIASSSTLEEELEGTLL